MNVLLNVYVLALRKKSEPLLPEGTVNVHTWHYSKFTERGAHKNGAVAKVRILVELGIL